MIVFCSQEDYVDNGWRQFELNAILAMIIQRPLREKHWPHVTALFTGGYLMSDTFKITGDMARSQC